eukprot:1051795-Pleurochrysis_carterae.AAC.3
MSTEWATANVQKDVGAPLATKLERVSSMMLRIARSATPFSCWTNSPALSLWIVPTIRVGVSRPAFRRAAKPARNLRMCAGASCLLRIRCTALKRV